MGHSAGAYNASMVALDPRWLAHHGLQPAALAGFIGLAGPYNFLPLRVDALKPVFGFPDTPADSQPVLHASASAPPNSSATRPRAPKASSRVGACSSATGGSVKNAACRSMRWWRRRRVCAHRFAR